MTIAYEWDMATHDVINRGCEACEYKWSFGKGYKTEVTDLRIFSSMTEDCLKLQFKEEHEEDILNPKEKLFFPSCSSLASKFTKGFRFQGYTSGMSIKPCIMIKKLWKQQSFDKKYYINYGILILSVFMFFIGCGAYPEKITPTTDQTMLIRIISESALRDNRKIEAIQYVKDTEFLKQLALNKSKSNEVRIAALKRISDEETYKQIIEDNFDNSSLCKTLIKEINDQKFLKHIALKRHYKAFKGEKPVDMSVRLSAVKQLFDQSLIEQIAVSPFDNNSKPVDTEVRIPAVNKLRSQNVLERIVTNKNDNDLVRSKAISRITNDKLLESIALDLNESYEVIRAALFQISDQDFLSKVIVTYDDVEAVAIGVGKLTDKKILSKCASRYYSYFSKIKDSYFRSYISEIAKLKLALIDLYTESDKIELFPYIKLVEKSRQYSFSGSSEGFAVEGTGVTLYIRKKKDDIFNQYFKPYFPSNITFSGNSRTRTDAKFNIDTVIDKLIDMPEYTKMNWGEFVLNSDSSELKNAIIQNKITDQKDLEQIADKDEDSAVRKNALNKKNLLFNASQIASKVMKKKVVVQVVDGKFYKLASGVILDTANKVLWANTSSMKNLGWKAANKYCTEYSFSGYKNWRMPTKNELVSLFDKSKRNQLLIKRRFKSPIAHLTDLIKLSYPIIWSSEIQDKKAYGLDFENWSPKIKRYAINNFHAKAALPVKSIE